MSETTASAACTQAEFDMARAAGLFIATTADERASHAFAESVRAPLFDVLRDVTGSLALAQANSSDRVDWGKDDSIKRALECLAQHKLSMALPAND